MCLAIPCEVVEVGGERPDLATVSVQGVKRVVNTGLVDDLATGDWVLVHVGFAMSRIDEREARETLELLQELGVAYDEELDGLLGSEIE